MKSHIPKINSLLILLLVASFSFDNTYWAVRDDCLRAISAPAIVYLEDSASQFSSARIVTPNQFTAMLPDNLLAEATRTAGGWVFRVPFGYFKEYSVDLVGDGEILIENLLLSSGDTLCIAKEKAGYAFGGTRGEVNSFFQTHLRLYTDAELAAFDPSDLNTSLDLLLNARLSMLQTEFEKGDCPDYLKEMLVSAIYLQWTQPRVQALAQRYNRDQDPSTSPTDAELAFLDKVPDMAYNSRASEFSALADLERDAYMDRVLLRTKKRTVDTSVITAVLDTIAAKRFAARRRALEMSVIEWAVANRCSQCYAILEEAIQQRDILAYIIDIEENGLKLLAGARKGTVNGIAKRAGI